MATIKVASELSNVLVLAHGPACFDGTGAMWAAWRKFGDSADYIPINYGQDIDNEVFKNKEVFMLDFSFKRDRILKIAEVAKSLTIIDHHDTAKEELKGLDYAIFDMDKSGAVLSWEYFFPGEDVPEFLLYIQDRDLWRWKLPNSKEMAAALQLRPFTIEAYEEFSKLDKNTMLAEGKIVLRCINAQVDMICKQAFYAKVGDYEVPTVNATAFWSEVGNKLLDLYPDAKFSASYFETKEGVRKWSLRSRGRGANDFKVSEVAKKMGGGGHPDAAGFEEQLAQPVTRVKNDK